MSSNQLINVRMQIKLLAKQKNLVDWAAVLPEAVATYNKKRHSTTKHSPADVWGWRSLRKSKNPQVQETYATLTSEVRANTIAAAEKNLARCKARQRTRTDSFGSPLMVTLRFYPRRSTERNTLPYHGALPSAWPD